MEAESFKPSDPGEKLDAPDALAADQIPAAVKDVLATAQCIDMHTHLFPPCFEKLALWGIDELLTYHYLEAEFFRSSPMTPEQYWSLPKRDQADAIWRALFVENTPVSEATRGIVAVLTAFNLPAGSSDLGEARSFLKNQIIEEHVFIVLELAGVSSVVMTNEPSRPRRAAHLDERPPARLAFSSRVASGPAAAGMV